MRNPPPRAWLRLLQRLVITLVALFVATAGNYQLRPGVPTPPAVVVLAAEHEAAPRADASPVLRVAALARAADPLHVRKAGHPPVPHPGGIPTPRGPPAPHGEPRGPPARA